MKEEAQSITLYCDFLPNHAAHPALADSLKDIHREHLEQDMDAIVVRQGQLKALMIEPGEYVQLLVEARTLFCFGYFYSCVAMCGIVAERIIKDILRNSVYTQAEQGFSLPPEKAFDQLERVDISSLTNFLAAANLIGPDVLAAAKKLSELRNSYAHARGQNPEGDALKAITYLQKIVDDTVSILKTHTINEGNLVPKSTATQSADNKS